MAKQTISREELDSLLTAFDNSLKKINRKKYQGDAFGDDEVGVTELIDVAKDLILSLRSLTRSSHTYSMLVNRDERQAIATKIEVLTKNANNDRVDLFFDNLAKTVRLLRGMNLRSGWSLVAGAKESAYELDQKAAALEKREKKLATSLLALEKKTAEIEQIRNQISTYSKTIGQFVSNIESRQVELEQQSESTKVFENKLIEIDEQHQELLTKANDLITQAETALEVKTAEGLSKAFKTKAVSAGSKSSLWWVALAASFIAGAIFIGYKLIQSPEIELAHVLTRLSLIPVLLTGAWFSAARYVFQKNLAEDYDYKQVLMSSHVAFSRQLKEDTGSDEYYQDYIKGFLREIYQHPVKQKCVDTKDKESSAESTKISTELMDIKELRDLYSESRAEQERLFKHVADLRSELRNIYLEKAT